MERTFRKNIIRQIVINVFIVVIALVIFKGVSYSIDDDLLSDNKEILMKTGNMQVVLSTQKDKYEFTDILKDSVSDAVGMNQKGYDFSITNTGSMPIEYYEIRLVDQENKVSTLPHKYLRFVIKKDDNDYSDVYNLADVDSIIYSGYDLNVSDSSKFNLKLWLDGSDSNILNKQLYLAIEVTLYQKYDVYDNYVLYSSDNSSNVPIRTSIYNSISTVIPRKNGYVFQGWSSVSNGNVEYKSGSNYTEKKGKTLYAVWEKIDN